MNKSLSILLLHFITAFMLLTGCKSKPENTNTTETAPTAFRISAEGKNSSCPYLTADHNGNLVLSWVQATDSAESYLLYYAISENGGKAFGAPVAIPTSAGVYPHDENLSKILFKKNGDIMAMFAVSNPSEENSYAGLVYYTQSFDGGESWTAPRQLSQNTAQSIDERYFDMALLPSGEVAAVWLDSRKGMDSESMDKGAGTDMHHMHKEGSSLYFATTNGSQGFADERAIARQTCQCCRTDLYIDGKNQLHVAYRGILNGSIRDMMHMVSADNGRSFSAPKRISPDNWVIDGCPHTGPTMAANQKGMHFAWFTMGGGSGVFYNQQPDGQDFTPREQAGGAASAKHPQMITLKNGNIALVWDEHRQPGTSQIGLELRNEEGQLLRHAYITPDSASASFPVIAQADAGHVLVAYTRSNDKAKEVWYQLVRQEN